MARKVTPAQLKSMLRQAQHKRKQAIDQYNQKVRRHNQQVRQAVNKYNQAARSYNAQVRTNRQRINSALSQLRRLPATTTTRYTVYRESVFTMHSTYEQLEQTATRSRLGPYHDEFLGQSERETANSLNAMSSLLGGTPEPEDSEVEEDTDTTELRHRLRGVSVDLDDRWAGAVYALDPRNPDAARHFCTSAREIVVRILDVGAPDTEVLHVVGDCPRTEDGRPTRRAKIRYMLQKRAITERVAEEFVEQDIESVLQLFRVFNDATHGSAGKFSLQQLCSIKRRVEDSVLFLMNLSF